MGAQKKYFNEEERKVAKRENQKRYVEKHKEKIKESRKKYKDSNKKKIANYEKERAKTINGRASHLIGAYNMADKLMGRGKGDLTIPWVIENIFSKPCAHCGKTGWNIIGCNRIDNTKPHTMDNVEPCCLECNVKIQGKDSSKNVYQYTFNGELVKIWNSTKECSESGFTHAAEVARGERKQDKGYKFYYEPL